MAGVIPQPSLKAERAHRKEKGNVAAPSSDRVCNARMDAGSDWVERGSGGEARKMNVSEYWPLDEIAKVSLSSGERTQSDVCYKNAMRVQVGS